MADLAATNVTVTVNLKDKLTSGKKHRIQGTLTFGDGALTYPAGGVPLPAFGTFGMKRNLDMLILTDGASGNGLLWKYDVTNNKLRGYWPTGGGGTAPTAAATNPVLNTGATAVTSSAATAPIAPGQAKEFVAATTTIAAQTINFEAVGW